MSSVIATTAVVAALALPGQALAWTTATYQSGYLGVTGASVPNPDMGRVPRTFNFESFTTANYGILQMNYNAGSNSVPWSGSSHSSNTTNGEVYTGYGGVNMRCGRNAGSGLVYTTCQTNF